MSPCASCSGIYWRQMPRVLHPNLHLFTLVAFHILHAPAPTCAVPKTHLQYLYLILPCTPCTFIPLCTPCTAPTLMWCPRVLHSPAPIHTWCTQNSPASTCTSFLHVIHASAPFHTLYTQNSPAPSCSSFLRVLHAPALFTLGTRKKKLTCPYSNLVFPAPFHTCCPRELACTYSHMVSSCTGCTCTPS